MHAGSRQNYSGERVADQHGGAVLPTYRRAIMSIKHDPSAKRPCTNTTLPALMGLACSAVPRADMSVTALPARREGTPIYNNELSSFF